MEGVAYPHPAIRYPLPSVYPVRHKDIRFSLPAMTVGGPDEFPPVGTPHREAVEILVGGDFFQPGPVAVDQEQIELPAPGILAVRRKNDLAPVGVKIGGEIGAPEPGDLSR